MMRTARVASLANSDCGYGQSSTLLVAVELAYCTFESCLSHFNACWFRRDAIVNCVDAWEDEIEKEPTKGICTVTCGRSND